jgi:(S)-2-hydroxyglutarate dehydrogenase
VQRAGARGPLAIVGGGIVGLATALAAQRAFPGIEVIVIEKEARVGAHQSGRNSGVVHSGVYYAPGSIKARLCVEGAAAMSRFCEQHDVPIRRCGKVIVAAQESEVPGLEELRRRGEANGVRDLAIVGPGRLREIEPACGGAQALHVPGAAITDYGAVTATLARLVAGGGGAIRTGTRVVGVVDRGGEVALETTAGTFAARFVVNCAGLYSDRVARLAGTDPGVAILPFRGQYYELAIGPSRAVRGLIYPVPDPALPFLGAHLTKRIDGGVVAGPNAVLALAREGYRKSDVSLIDLKEMLLFRGFWRMALGNIRNGARETWQSLSKRAFLRALRRLMPGLQATDLLPGGSGVRAQAVDGRGLLVDDFRIVPAGRMIHVLNVPSPAATASLVIGRTIVETLASTFDLDART